MKTNIVGQIGNLPEIQQSAVAQPANLHIDTGGAGFSLRTQRETRFIYPGRPY